MYDKCYFCLDQLPKLKKESTASFFVNFGGAGVQKSRPTLLYCPPLSLAFVFVFVISKVHQDEWFKFLKFLKQFWNFVWLMRSEWLVRLLQWFDWLGNQSIFWFNSFFILKRRCAFCFQSFSAVDLRSLLKVDCVVSIPAPPPPPSPSLALFVTVKVAGIN